MTPTPPPEVRFTTRALRAGLSPLEVATILGADRAAVAKHVRSALRARGLPAPPPDADDAGLLQALGEDDTAPPAPSTPCPDDLVVWTLANGRLDGPLLLATAEHAADCATCMGRLMSAHGDDPPAPARPAEPSDWLGIVVVVLIAAAFVALFLL